jgi:hypothetical protein
MFEKALPLPPNEKFPNDCDFEFPLGKGSFAGVGDGGSEALSELELFTLFLLLITGVEYSELPSK